MWLIIPLSDVPMKKITLSLVSTLLLLALAFPSTAQPRILSTEAAKYVGRKATVCGQVASVNYARANKDRPTFLNLDKGYPDQKFTAVILGENRNKFSKPPEITYAARKICVTGTISMSQGVAQIIVSEPSQITRDE
jgi:hypothetical protein